MRWRAVAIAFLLAAFLAGCGGQAEEAPVREEPIVPEPVVEAPAEDAALPEMAEGLPDWAGAYFGQVLAYESENPGAEYALIDLIGGDVPALAAGYGGYTASLYQYGEGALHTLMDRWPYGISGNVGYEYLPGQGVIRNCSTGLAGLILYTSYHRVTEDWALDGYTLALWNFNDRNGNRQMDEDEEETLGQVAFYYLEDAEIAREAYDSCAVGASSDYMYIRGDVSCLEFLEQLNALAVS